MEESDMKQLASFLKDEEVKVVWREEERTKVGRGKISHDDENFVHSCEFAAPNQGMTW